MCLLYILSGHLLALPSSAPFDKWKRAKTHLFVNKAPSTQHSWISSLAPTNNFWHFICSAFLHHCDDDDDCGDWLYLSFYSIRLATTVSKRHKLRPLACPGRCLVMKQTHSMRWDFVTTLWLTPSLMYLIPPVGDRFIMNSSLQSSSGLLASLRSCSIIVVLGVVEKRGRGVLELKSTTWSRVRRKY